jgi:uncharacterized protein with PhoU and TrkA domain
LDLAESGSVSEIAKILGREIEPLDEGNQNAPPPSNTVGSISIAEGSDLVARTLGSRS